MPFLFRKSTIKQNRDGTIEPIARKFLYICTDLEILKMCIRDRWEALTPRTG